MTFEEYQQKATNTAHYPSFGAKYVYPALGLASEAGEVAGKIKKAIRDNEGVIDEARKAEIKKELGDVLWYVAQVATELGLSLEEIGEENIAKLASREERGKIGGDGDER